MMSGASNSNISGFLNETTEIEQKITNAKTYITKIQEFQGQILISTSTTQEDNTIRERERLVSGTRDLLVECKDRIRNIQHENSRIPSSDPNFGIRQQRYEFLRTKLSNVLEEYRLAESNFMKQSKDRMARQYKVVNPNASQQEIDDYVSSTDSQPIFQQALLRTNEAKSALVEVQKRHEDIKSIEKTIAELASLFQQLHLQVEEQDQTVVNIENNAVETSQKIEQSTQQLGKAETLAIAARKKKWICFGIFIVIVIIVVVVVLVQFKGNNSNNNSNNNNNNNNNNNSNPKTTTTLAATPAAAATVS